MEGIIIDLMVVRWKKKAKRQKIKEMRSVKN